MDVADGSRSGAPEPERDAAQMREAPLAVKHQHGRERRQKAQRGGGGGEDEGLGVLADHAQALQEQGLAARNAAPVGRVVRRERVRVDEAAERPDQSEDRQRDRYQRPGVPAAEDLGPGEQDLEAIEVFHL